MVVFFVLNGPVQRRPLEPIDVMHPGSTNRILVYFPVFHDDNKVLFGLGDQIEKEPWLSQWPGKKIYDEQGNPQIEVVRGSVQSGPDEIHQVDGLSGATLTANGVTYLIQYWTGSHGFGPYLAKVSSEANDNG